LARRSYKRTIPFLLVIPLLAIGFVALQATGDGLDEVRKEGVEMVTADGIWVWHDFQFTERCEVMKAKLSDWKKGYEESGRKFAMTDMEDSEWGPDSWARMEEFNMGYRLELRQGNKCGFAVGLPKEASTWSGLVQRVKRFLHLK
jgi:hypothetical protein